MALLEKQLIVKKSTIPQSGKGLFTRKFIPKGTRIVEYKGRITRWKDVEDEDGNNAYIFYVKRYHVIDARPVTSALARYANDANGLVRIPGVRNNCDYITDGLKAYIESKKDIPAGGEILVDYGKDYWKVIRHNLRLVKDAEKEKSGKQGKGGKGAKKKLNGQKILRDMKAGKDRRSKGATLTKDLTRKTRHRKSTSARKSISKRPSKFRVTTGS